MLIGRFLYKDFIFIGRVYDGVVYPLSEHDLNISQLCDENMLKSDRKNKIDKPCYILDELKVLPPCVPSKIVCVGLNYKDHAEEFGLPIPKEPILFLKPPTTVIGHGESIILPKQSSHVEYEGELAVVIGKKAKNVSQSDAFKVVLGYTCANDVTARDLQKKDQQWTRSKSFDTFCPIGLYIATDINPANLNLRVYLNGELKQFTNTNKLIFDVPALVSYISSIMTLMPGDIILTGTSSGVGKVEKGDKIEVVVDKIGTLENFVNA